VLKNVSQLRVQLYGSLGATGKGHGSDKAIILGLMGELPAEINPDVIPGILEQVREQQVLSLLGTHSIEFIEKRHLTLHKRKSLPYHPNGMRFEAFNSRGDEIHAAVYYSVGGGFVVDEAAATGDDPIVEARVELPLPFTTGLSRTVVIMKGFYRVA